MKFWQRINKNTFRGMAAALVVAAAVMGGTDAALAAGEPVTEEQTKIISASLLQTGGTVFPIGNDNAAYARYFTGQSFLFPMANDTVSVSNVTFAPSCINTGILTAVRVRSWSGYQAVDIIRSGDRTR